MFAHVPASSLLDPALRSGGSWPSASLSASGVIALTAAFGSIARSFSCLAPSTVLSSGDTSSSASPVLPGGFPFRPFWPGSRRRRHYASISPGLSVRMANAVLSHRATYVTSVSLQLDLVGQRQKLQVWPAEHGQVARLARKGPDDLDGLGSRASDPKEGRQCSLETYSRGLVTDWCMTRDQHEKIGRDNNDTGERSWGVAYSRIRRQGRSKSPRRTQAA